MGADPLCPHGLRWLCLEEEISGQVGSDRWVGGGLRLCAGRWAPTMRLLTLSLCSFRQLVARDAFFCA